MSNGAAESRADRPGGATGAAPQPARKSGRGLAGLALLLALVALGLAAYPFYRQLTAPATIDGGLDALRAAQQLQADELQRVIGNSAEIESQLRRQQQRIDESAAASPTLAATSTPSALTPESQRALKLAQTEYLLANANDRLLVQRDVNGALTLLLAAQSLASQVDIPALSTVRDELAKEIEALRSDPGIDLAAVLARLQTLARTVLDLPARGAQFGSTRENGVPEATPATSDSPAAESTLELALGSAWQKFHSLFEFRRERGAQRPALGPDAAAYLRINLALQLQIAELALLRNDASVYQQSLGSVRRWLDDYLDPAAASVTTARAEVDQLLALRLDRPLPDISRSLNALRPLLDAQAGQPSPAVSAEPSAAVDATATDKSAGTADSAGTAVQTDSAPGAGAGQ